MVWAALANSAYCVQIFIKTLTGRTIILEIDISSSSVGDLKELYSEQESIARGSFTFMYAGKQLDDQLDNVLLKDSGVSKNR